MSIVTSTLDRPLPSAALDERPLLELLPEPAARWVRRCVATDAPAYTQVRLELEGITKIGPWHRFTATQTIRPRHGYRWKVRTWVAGAPVVGVENMWPSSARRHWLAAGLVPFGRAEGPELLCSAAGRLAAESVFVPTASALASWDVSALDDSAFATWRIGSRVDRVRLDVAPNGRLRSVSLRRWGTPPGGRYGRHPFGLRFEDEMTVGGVTIPASMTASWWWGTDRQDEGTILRARVVAAHFS